MQHFIAAIETHGFAVVPGVLQTHEIASLTKAIEDVGPCEAVKQRGGNTFGIRNLLTLVPAVAQVAKHDAVRSLVEPLLGKSAQVVRGIFFDKTPDANWKVRWHQDLSIAVQEKRDVEGFGPWSVKAGIQHVQPPVSILENMLSVRLHLDDTTEENGALRVIAGSHRHGRLSADEIQRWRAEGDIATCPVPRGGAFVMRPMLLHSCLLRNMAQH